MLTNKKVSYHIERDTMNSRMKRKKTEKETDKVEMDLEKGY